MTNTYIALRTITLATATSSVTFGSIPQTYRDLVVVATAIGTSATNCLMRFNSDAASNYPYVIMFGTGSSAGSATNNFGGVVISDIFTTTGAIGTAHIMDYSATDKHKTTLGRKDRADDGVAAYANRWTNTAAITTVSFQMTSGTISAGSTFSLYGIRS